MGRLKYLKTPKVNLESGDKKINYSSKKTPALIVNWILFESFEGTVLGIEKDGYKNQCFPNPTDRYIKIKSDYVPDDIKNYTLVDLNGNIMYRRSKNYLKNINEKIDISSFNHLFLVINEGEKLFETKNHYQ